MPIKLNGATSGYTQIQAAAVAGNNVLALPTTGTTLLSDGNTLTFTQTQTFAGNTGALAFACNNIGEVVTIASSAPTATTNYDITTQSVIYNPVATTNNWTINFRANSTNTLNSIMSVGQAVTCVYIATVSAVSSYNNGYTVDGATVVPKWAGGVAPTIGYINSLNVYTYTLIKTANATWVVLANLQKFA